MNTVLTALVIIFGALALTFHALTLFLKKLPSKVFGYLNIACHLSHYACVSLRFRDLELTVLVLMTSLLLYLLLTFVRVKLFEAPEVESEGKNDI